uniref:Uncharacterized protein n=1 Tax=Sphaerodactylus townsendi TaxID=933632 RepID=A0ACB8FWZ6_9SAUR
MHSAQQHSSSKADLSHEELPGPNTPSLEVQVCITSEVERRHRSLIIGWQPSVESVKGHRFRWQGAQQHNSVQSDFSLNPLK